MVCTNSVSRDSAWCWSRPRCCPRNGQPVHAKTGLDNAENSPFADDFEFLDDVHGTIHLNRMETDVINSPEFQRLFRLGQLGFVDLVYPTANHTRAAHSIGACFLSKKLVDALNANRERLKRAPGTASPQAQGPHISYAETVLIRLAGLLHDISHGPLSHDIEKKTHIIYPTPTQLTNAVKAGGGKLLGLSEPGPRAVVA